MCNSKICFKCNESQPLTEFYKHSGMADGHLNKCKSCAKKDTKENILKNHDYYIEYERNRANLPHRIAGRLAYRQSEKGKEAERKFKAMYRQTEISKEAAKKYSQTEIGKEVLRKSKTKWAENNVIKRSASHIINNAVRDKKIVKPDNCEVCHVVHHRIHGHHDDYAYPMSVRWLCPKCHASWHKLNGSAING